MQSFGAKLVSKEPFNFDTFTKIADNVFGGRPIEEVALEICQNPQNLIGQGNSKRVYSIPNIQDYVLAVLKKKFNPMAEPTPFHSTPNDMGRFNFGQPIAENDNGLFIAGRVAGQEHSLPTWILEYKEAIKNNGVIASPKAEFVLNQLTNIAEFPMKAYNELAAKLKYLNENSARVDPINPNNILVDNAQKSLNIIDINDSIPNMPNPLNSVRDMEVLLLDSLLHKAYKDALSDKKAENLGETAKIIIEKCKAAAKNINLNTNPQNTQRFFEFVQNRLKKTKNRETFFVENYQKFVNMYKDLLNS